MNEEERKDIYLYYKMLNNKSEIYFKVYRECSNICEIDIYNKEKFLVWYPISLSQFLKIFSNKI